MIYIAGDIMSIGSQTESKIIEDKLKKHDFYSARLNAEINDKNAQTVESNNKLAERIVAQDTAQIDKADIFIINYKPYAIGTTVEIGQIYEHWRHNKDIKVIAIYDDIRRTELPEVGDRRSFSVNQYVYGIILAMTKGKGFISFSQLDDAIDKLLTY